MSIGKMVAGVAGLGVAGFIGRNAARRKREMEFDAIRDQYERMATWSDPDIVNALEELRSFDFGKLTTESPRTEKREELDSELKALSDAYYTF